MKIESTQVTKLVLTELVRLDPICVIVEDLGKSQGKITITCYGSLSVRVMSIISQRT